MTARSMRVLVFGDTHAPFHHPLVVKLIMHVIFKWKPDLVIHNGDMFDCGAVSKFPKDPDRTRNLYREMLVGHQILGVIPDSIERVFCMGNHEDRIRKYLWRQAPEIWGFLSDEDLLGLQDIGWHVVPVNESFKIGDLVVAHDFGKWGKTALKDAMGLHPQKTVVIGHTHRLESLTINEHNVKTTGISTGWGGIVEAVPYSHHDRIRKEWRHGFAPGYLYDNGEPQLTDVAITVNGGHCWCVFDGQRFEVNQ